MPSEEALERLIELVVKRTEQANTYFLKSIGSSIQKLQTLTPSKAHQLVQMLKYGGGYDDIVKKISEITDLSLKDIDKIFSSYAKMDYNFYEKFYQYRDIPFVPLYQNETLRNQTIALANMVKNEIYDYFRPNVLGYSIRDTNGVIKFKGLREIYNQMLDTALLNVGQGKETFDSAVYNILKEVGTSGIKKLDYKSGRSIRLDSAVKMHLRGALTELHTQNQKIIGEQIGSDGVEITVHRNPAIDHEKVQGRQFYKEDFDNLQHGLIAKDVNNKVYTLDHDDKNGYRPIGTMNCYHWTFDIIVGVNKPRYSDKELQQIIDTNREGFEFEGKHYTNYEGEQLQRILERRIREQKDVQIIAKASNNQKLIYKSQYNITKLTNKYKELSNISNLPTKMQRLRVSSYKRVAKSKL